MSQDYTFHPLSSDRWNDFSALFEQPGHQNHCWCMSWRLRGSDYNKLDDAGRKTAMKAVVEAGVPTGILMYTGDRAVGWCSVAPRETYERLVRSKTITTIDDQPSWAVMCFFMDQSVRGQHLGAVLLKAAAEFALSQGAVIVEGYPVEPVMGSRGKPKKDSGAYRGTKSMFLDAGFKEVGRTNNDHPIMRFVA